MVFGGLALKSVSFFLRFIQFCCAAISLGVFSYYLAALHNHHLAIPNWQRAVTGLSGAAVLYTVFALALLCFLAGVPFFSLLGILLDIAFIGAFIYIAYETRGGDGSCSGNVNTPLGSGNTNGANTVSSGTGGGFVRLPSLRTACKLETAVFAVAIVACVFFFLSILIELALIKHHRHEKRFGPSPNNGYTAGTPRRRFWQRKPKRDAEYLGAEKNPNALPVHATPADMRTSYATDATAVGNEVPMNKYGNGPVGAAYGDGYVGRQSAGTTGYGAHGYATNAAPHNATGTF